MEFQIVELELDANGNETKRKPVLHTFGTRGEAVTRVESVIAHYQQYGYDSEHDSWWALAANGDRMAFVIKPIPPP
jgi:hypothetical protein